MGRKRSSRRFWEEEKIRRLTQYAKSLAEIHPNVYYESHPHTILKLALLRQFVSVYTTIISKYYHNMVFIDIFAGSGINRIINKGDLIVGSPVIAVDAPYQFTELIFIEKNSVFKEALQARLASDVLPENNSFVYEGDCNELIEKVIEDHITKDTHALIFIDPEGMEVSWPALEKLLECRGDVIYNFMSSGIQRHLGRCLSQNALQGDIEKMNSFMGGEEWKKAKNIDNLKSIYIEKLKGKKNMNRYREICIPICVKGRRGFQYDLLFLARKTRGNNPWIRSITQAKEKIERNTSNTVAKVLDVFAGRQSRLDLFDEGVMDELSPQKSLSDF